MRGRRLGFDRGASEAVTVEEVQDQAVPGVRLLGHEHMAGLDLGVFGAGDALGKGAVHRDGGAE